MGGIVIKKEIIKALLYLPEYDDINVQHLRDYMSDLDLRNMIIDMNILISKSNLSENELFIIKSLKEEVTQECIADKLGISQSGISQKINTIVKKINKCAS